MKHFNLIFDLLLQPFIFIKNQLYIKSVLQTYLQHTILSNWTTVRNNLSHLVFLILLTVSIQAGTTITCEECPPDQTCKDIDSCKSFSSCSWIENSPPVSDICQNKVCSDYTDATSCNDESDILTCHWDSGTSSCGGHAPVADAGNDHTILTSDTNIPLDGNNSTVFTGTIVNYHWEDENNDVLYDGPDPIVNVPNIYSQPSTHTITLTVTDSSDQTDIDTMTITVLDSFGDCSDPHLEFSLNINGSETNITGLSSNINQVRDNYWEFNATAAQEEDINGTLRINVYAPNFTEICKIELLDADTCAPVPGYSFEEIKGVEMGIYVNTDKSYLLHLDDSCGNRASAVVSMLWYPDINGTDDYGGYYPEPAIFEGSDYVDPAVDYISTKIVNKDHDLRIKVVKDDGSLFTGYKGSFRLDMVDARDYGDLSCSQLPRLKYNGVLGVDSNDNGIMHTGDGSTAHGPSLIYEKAAKNARYRMSYLVNENSGIINYEDLLLTNGCIGNKQSCLWGVLTSMANNKTDPNLPAYTLADVCGLYCDPGAGQFGTGDNQISQECSDCVFGSANSYSDCTDNFAVRPKIFDVNITEGSIFKAKKTENFLFEALDEEDTASLNYNEAQTTSFYIDLNVTNNENCPVKNLTISPLVSFSDGSHQDNFYFNDIGDINMSIHETNGTEFAIVDADDTPLEDRLIEEFNVSFTVIPDHFNINVTLTNHNTSANFTYLNDFNDTGGNPDMAANLDINISAMNNAGGVTTNYIDGCYARNNDLNLTFDPFYTAPLTKILYYHVADGNISGDDLNTTEPNFSISGPWESTQASGFKPNAPDGNGTNNSEYKLNFNRKIDQVVQAFAMNLTDVNMTDTDNVEGNQTGITGQTAFMHYAKAKPSVGIGLTYTSKTEVALTPILIDVYCDPGGVFSIDPSYDSCADLGIDLSAPWAISEGHNSDAGDGNITLKIIDPLVDIEEGSGAPSLAYTNISIITDGKDDNLTVNRGPNPKFILTVNIELDATSDAWLIHNPSSLPIFPSPFYKVKFISPSVWAGPGGTGSVVDTDVNTNSNTRSSW